MTPVRPLAVLVALALGFVPALAHAQADPAQVCGATLERARSAHENGKLRLAREGYAACARESCPTELRADCAKKRDEVAQALPTTSFVVTDEAGRDLDAKVVIDDGSIPVTLGRAIPLDPGVHDLTWHLPDGTRGFRKITIVEGQKGRLVTLAPEPKTAPAQSLPGALAPPTVPANASTDRSPWPWVLIGSSGALFVAASLLEILALTEDGKRKDRLNDYVTSRGEPSTIREAYLESAKSHYDAARNNETAAITCAVVGATALAVGVTWLLVRDARERSHAAPLQPATGGMRFALTF